MNLVSSHHSARQFRRSTTAGLLWLAAGALLFASQVRAQSHPDAAVRESSVLFPKAGTAWNAETQPDLVAFDAWAQSFAKAKSAHRLPAGSVAALENEGVRLARLRRTALLGLMRTDPARAVAASVPAAVRAAMPAGVAAQLETPFSGVGDYTAYCQLRAPGGPKVRPERTEITLDGSVYKAHVYGRRVGLTSRRNVFLHGFLIDGEAVLDENVLRVLPAGEAAIETRTPRNIGKAAPTGGRLLVEGGGTLYRFASADQIVRAEAGLRALEAHRTPEFSGFPEHSALEDPARVPAEPDTAYTTGNKKVLVIRVDFSDLPGEPISVTAALDVANGQVAPFYDASSYHLTSLTNTISTPVYRLPRTAASYATAGDNNGLHTDARTLAGANYDVASYDRVCVAFANLGGISGSQIKYGGLGQLGGPYFWTNGEFDFRVVAHELGHTYGLLHANLWQVADGNPASLSGSTEEYGDDFDTMGANYANTQAADFNTWYKTQLDWLPAANVQTITQSGTYRVHRFDSGSATGILALKFSRDSTRDYWVTARRNFTGNFSMSHGVYVTWGYYSKGFQDNVLDLQTPGSSVTDAALPTGSTFTDSGAGISITAVSEGGTEPDLYEDVSITFNSTGVAPAVTSPAFATTEANQAFTYQITASNSPTSFNAIDLPAGLSIDTATGLISGAVTTGGTYSVTLQASNASGTGSATLTLSVTVSNDNFNSAQILTDASGSVTGSNVGATKEVGEPDHASHAGGTSVWYRWTAQDAGDVTFATAGSSFDTLLAVYTGGSVGGLTEVASNDDVATGGSTSQVTFHALKGTTYSIAVDGYNGSTGSVALSWNQQVIFAPSILNDGNAQGTVGTPFSLQIAASDEPTSYDAAGLPAGLSVDPTTGLISGTPTADGTFDITLVAANEAGPGYGFLSLVILPLPPAVTSATAVGGQVGVAFTYQIVATNQPTGYTATGLPGGLSVDPATGVVSGTFAQAGVYTFTVTATNAGGSASAAVRVTVLPAKPLVTSATTASAQVGAAFTYRITASNSPTQFSATGLPAGLSLNTATGVVSGTPTRAGIYTFTVTATNAGGAGSASVTVTVLPAKPAVTSAATASAQVDVPFTYQIAATNGPTSYAATGLPTGLSVDAATGVVSGTFTQVGTYTLTVTATNAGGSASATVRVTVAPPPLPVIDSAANAGGQVGLPFRFQVTATNAPTAFTATNLPPGLTADGSVISGVPTQSGTFTVTLTAGNRYGTVTDLLMITVVPDPRGINLAVTAPAITAGTGELGKFLLTIATPQATDTFVHYTVKGSAVNGTDYVFLKGTAKIKAGKTTKTIKVRPLGPGAGPGLKRTVVLILQPNESYSINTPGKFKVKIVGQ